MFIGKTNNNIWKTSIRI